LKLGIEGKLPENFQKYENFQKIYKKSQRNLSKKLVKDINRKLIGIE